MTLLYNPFESYFDAQGRPTASGQQLLARIGLVGIPAGGTAGQFLSKDTDADYDAEWVNLAGAGSGSFDFDDGNATGGGVEFMLEEGGA